MENPEVQIETQPEEPSEKRRLRVRCYCECFYDTYIDVEKDMTLKEAFEYASDHKENLPVTNLEILPDSAELDKCDLDNPNHTFFET